jgi:hypothetical protein
LRLLQVPPMERAGLEELCELKSLDQDGTDLQLTERLINQLNIDKARVYLGLRERRDGYSMGKHGLIYSKIFDYSVLYFIMMNTVTLSLEHFDKDMCSRFHPALISECQDPTFVAVDTGLNYLFNIMFSIELILKVCRRGKEKSTRV